MGRDWKERIDGNKEVPTEDKREKKRMRLAQVSVGAGEGTAIP